MSGSRCTSKTYFVCVCVCVCIQYKKESQPYLEQHEGKWMITVFSF